MSNRRVRLLNIHIDNINIHQLLCDFDSGVIFTPNVDHLIKLQKNELFYDSYKKADWVICDSKILFFLSRLLGDPIIETIQGSSFFPAFCNFHRDNPNCRIFLLGAMPGVGQIAQDKINRRIGRSIVVGNYSPPFGFERSDAENEKIIEAINQTTATVLVVGLGAPKQEIWIMDHKGALPQIKQFLALGATIDFEAGKIKRAPIILQKVGLEWLYRLYKEPERLIKRYLIEDIPIFTLVLKQMMGKYRNPFD